MEEDDEFGDLYTDVLRPFASSSSLSSAPQPHQSSPAPSFIDLNLNLNAPQISYAAPHSDSSAPDQITPPDRRESIPAAVAVDAVIDGGGEDASGDPRVHKDEESADGDGARVLDAEFADRASTERVAVDDGGEVEVKGVDLVDREVKFDIEDDAGNDIGSEPVIPGLSSDAAAGVSLRVDEGGDNGGEGDDWDSDSDDDLQIVLNDNNHMAMERGGMVDDDDEEDEDGGLVIVAGGDPNQGVEEQEWGENTTLPVDGERKDAAETAKCAAGGGGVSLVPKSGYGNHGYHPFHSPFKYVRPGAAPMPGATTSAPGGPPGQIRPVANMVGRGRGDWRPPGIKGGAAMQKGFHAGPGLPGWGSSAAGRGFGSGLEFTLPSHKTIFDVDVESFEEKPWKYPNVDASDFFNFGLNEDSWKDYCKQLEQLRLESTMQSKIRVYESGRTEQEYDPDLPPELAAATGIHDVPVENANSMKSDVGQSDVMKGSGRLRPPLPTGRAIQVEGGYGERLPSVDTRPPRIRDSDAVIEIVLQDTEDDDSSAGIGVQDQPEGGEPRKEDFIEDHVVGDEIPRLEPECFDGFPQDYNGRKKELAGRRMPFMNSNPANIPNGDQNLFFPQEEPINYTGSRGKNPRSFGGNFSSSREERQMQKRVRGQSPPITPVRELTTDDSQKEESVESMGGRNSALLSSPVIKDVKEFSVEDKDTELEETGTADESPRLEKEEIDLNTVDKIDILEDGIAKRQKLTSRVEQPLLDEVDDWEDSKAARSSDNSKARSASSRDNQKRQEGFEEEVVQDPQSAHLGSSRLHPDENEQGLYRREHDGKQEPERNRMVLKGREGSYPHKDRHPISAHQLHTNTDGFDRQKERADMDWARRDDDLYSRRVRNDEPRKRDRAKVRENERNDREDSLHSRKQLDNGSYRVPYDKDVGSRHRERAEGLRIRYEAVEDYHSKRRKDEEYPRREHIDKEETLHGYRENASRRKRERDEVLDPRKRDDLQRSRNNLDDQYANRQKDEAWHLRDRGDRQRDREEWHRMKQSHEEHLPKREREEGRSSVRSGRGVEDKVWIGHVRAKDEHKVSEKEYQSREAMRHNEQLKRRDRIRDESPHHKGRDDTYSQGNHYTSEERRSRQERSTSRSDRVANASDNPRMHDRKHKEGLRRSKEPDVSELHSLGLSKRSQENQSGPTNEKGLKGSGNEERPEHEIPGHRLSKKQRDGMSSDDEPQDSHRGRTKLERWTSHKERDFSISKSSSSLKFKDIDKDNNDGSIEAGKPVDESAKTVDVENQHLLSAEGRDSVDTESRDADSKELGDRHLDTVERLKKRSERFKLPMPSEKEAQVIKKLESEPLPSAKTENPVDSKVKQERPARKRRWISN
ncbi:FIP1[V]-like protein [Gastrolobium bilobum]|uniref:FIP1[V]-like protein n=1 Tax=Gastrolobium bilobum TaxID=150636 RepID=UPI002AB07BD0|nr:FIP1[V]-like protein [Gastrolobium bilobum]